MDRCSRNYIAKLDCSEVVMDFSLIYPLHGGLYASVRSNCAHIPLLPELIDFSLSNVHDDTSKISKLKSVVWNFV